MVTCLPAGVTGKSSAATVAKDVLRSFPVKTGFMDGIGGGLWSERTDVRLGDVVVSQSSTAEAISILNIVLQRFQERRKTLQQLLCGFQGLGILGTG